MSRPAPMFQGTPVTEFELLHLRQLLQTTPMPALFTLKAFLLR